MEPHRQKYNTALWGHVQRITPRHNVLKSQNKGKNPKGYQRERQISYKEATTAPVMISHWQQ